MSYPASRSYGGPRRRGLRAPLLIVGVVVILAVAAVVGLLVKQSDDRKAKARSYAQAVAVTRAFLAAFGTGDATTIAADTTPATAGYASTTIPALRSSLQVVSATYTAGTVVTGADPGAPFTAHVVLRGLGDWNYNGALVLAKVSGQWKVDFTAQTVFPELASNDTLARTRTLGTRGQIVLTNGTPLAGQDGELDGNLLGTTGKYTAAQAAAAGPEFVAGDVGGLTGLERAYNDELAGTPGGALSINNSAGQPTKTLFSHATTNGHNVVVSINMAIQRAAEAALGTLPAAQTGSLVALNMSTGQILAVVNHPYDGYGRALRGQYPPGSTFKIITTTAALMSGKSASTVLQCGPTVSVDGETFKNAESESYGPIDLETAFAKSCNTAFINLETTLPAGAIQTAARLYGFSNAPAPNLNATTGGPLPIASFGGSVPYPLDGADAAAEAIGQGRILTSPLQMASVAAAVGSGTWHEPYVTAAVPANEPAHVIPPSVVATLHTFMNAVVTSGTAQDSGLPSGTFGKTGTAEYGDATPPATVAWFVGFRDGIAFACQVGGDTESGGFGASSAAPIVAQFLKSLD